MTDGKNNLLEYTTTCTPCVKEVTDRDQQSWILNALLVSYSQINRH